MTLDDLFDNIEGVGKRKYSRQAFSLPRNHPEYLNEWNRHNKEKKSIYSKKTYNKMYKGNYIALRKKTLRHKYGITIEEYNEMLVDQNYLCKLCNKKKKLVIDHCHKTKRVRGLLCDSCNTKLGWLENREQAIMEYRK